MRSPHLSPADFEAAQHAPAPPRPSHSVRPPSAGVPREISVSRHMRHLAVSRFKVVMQHRVASAASHIERACTPHEGHMVGLRVV